jgi:UDP-glucose 4-epimerase
LSEVPIEFAPHRPGEQQESFVNADKAREVLGWVPNVPLAEGLEKTYAWFARRNEGVTV